MTTAPSVDLHDLASGLSNALSVARGLLVSFDYGDFKFRPEIAQSALQQGGFAGSASSSDSA
jgi:hypothetical protein